MKQESISFIQPSTSDISPINVGQVHTKLENLSFEHPNLKMGGLLVEYRIKLLCWCIAAERLATGLRSLERE